MILEFVKQVNAGILKEEIEAALPELDFTLTTDGDFGKIEVPDTTPENDIEKIKQVVEDHVYKSDEEIREEEQTQKETDWINATLEEKVELLGKEHGYVK